MKMIYDHNRLAANMRGAKIHALSGPWDVVMAAMGLAGGYTDRLDWEECHFESIENDGTDLIFNFASAPANHLDRTTFQVLFDADGARGRIWREGERRPWPHARERKTGWAGCN